ncbi:uncharacterized protein LOC126845193 [Adelges cooleyi]|uniref:uncharacterized protein LOC126845193 n=1 Tax=Adelges cooleyi TaxID=133065 RepID=UPI00217F89B8|nr:uncharacterized protein LOC126845193 [Adelges cooleyi]
MKVIYVFLFCAIVNVLADYDSLASRRKLDTTNQFIDIHIFRSTFNDKIKEIVRLGDDMKRLSHMCAVCDKPIGDNETSQHGLEDQLQAILLEGTGIHPTEVAILGKYVLSDNRK